uniref:SSR2857 PROTEIN n=1 Tax=Synechocystis sp. PCC 6803 TaxID=1148 RepID=UPI0001E070A1|nr:Chain A, SSR2857 PROTEIN [Synechocystis sp. PCC 6803]2XMM_B Chain B, SSR2857 PROTEIN [Synechocystis sp. PCC 6803]2XMV_A Chain A, SSR2857 PROTEIN [Synechocystis sp. PCC 6803]2XMV_B Chain B, SSR2857 PROTEIN [Synechocystis sp. PCC 6803]2XMV_C Chain C, SSR2857 PROTEIN [Synechocystis sp. PCC 6803]2XMV_D Chain D, SSR2857 PROTEIN [Synechocystis sp. PCC 6803]2XMV_E Chain E, SSR2857 PROTEIN [Synechocystis sp. PCC 6803]2XMV_F Chain F, SSR2857 PROTEIN [Synechocystis sp. PCC 6803]
MTIQLTVPTIACEACAEAVTKAVQNEDAQATVQVDLTSKKVTITSALGEEQLRTAIASAGYEVE